MFDQRCSGSRRDAWRKVISVAPKHMPLAAILRKVYCMLLITWLVHFFLYSGSKVKCWALLLMVWFDSLYWCILSFKVFLWLYFFINFLDWLIFMALESHPACRKIGFVSSDELWFRLWFGLFFFFLPQMFLGMPSLLKWIILSVKEHVFSVAYGEGLTSCCLYGETKRTARLLQKKQSG